MRPTQAFWPLPQNSRKLVLGTTDTLRRWRNARWLFLTKLWGAKSYIGQSDRCVSPREHELSVKSNGITHLPLHCRVCTCAPRLQDLGRSKDATARELMKAFYIASRRNARVSESSLSSFSSEERFMCGMAMLIFHWVCLPFQCACVVNSLY